MSELDKNLNFYLKEKERLMQEHYGKYVVIADGKVDGEYNTESDAVTKTLEKGIKFGEFIVKLIAINDGSVNYCISAIFA
jgi:hypothetical protein